MIRRVEGHSKSVIRRCGCNQEGRRLSWETEIEEVGFEVFPERCNRVAISNLEGGVPSNRGIVTERIEKVFQFGGASRCRDELILLGKLVGPGFCS